VDVKTEKDERYHEDSTDRNAETNQHIAPHGQVLLVVNVENTVGEHLHIAVGNIRQRFGNAVGNDSGFNQGRIEIFGRPEDCMIRHKVIGTNHLCYIVVLHSLKFKKNKIYV
jgi:hypothetical protein